MSNRVASHVLKKLQLNTHYFYSLHTNKIRRLTYSFSFTMKISSALVVSIKYEFSYKFINIFLYFQIQFNSFNFLQNLLFSSSCSPHDSSFSKKLFSYSLFLSNIFPYLISILRFLFLFSFFYQTLPPPA